MEFLISKSNSFIHKLLTFSTYSRLEYKTLSGHPHPVSRSFDSASVDLPCLAGKSTGSALQITSQQQFLRPYPFKLTAFQQAKHPLVAPLCPHHQVRDFLLL